MAWPVSGVCLARGEYTGGKIPYEDGSHDTSDEAKCYRGGALGIQAAADAPPLLLTTAPA